MSGAGFGGAGRGVTGQQWARCMIMMMAMQGWGKPGVNFGGLELGAPLDVHFYFPGYADGGISGELMWTGNAFAWAKWPRGAPTPASTASASLDSLDSASRKLRFPVGPDSSGR